MKQAIVVIVFVTAFLVAHLLSNSGLNPESPLMFAGFMLWPLLVVSAVGFLLRQVSAIIVLLISSVFYAVWFGFIYIGLFLLHLDSLDPWIVNFAVVYSVPVYLVFGALLTHRNSSSEKRN